LGKKSSENNSNLNKNQSSLRWKELNASTCSIHTVSNNAGSISFQDETVQLKPQILINIAPSAGSGKSKSISCSDSSSVIVALPDLSLMQEKLSDWKLRYGKSSTTSLSPSAAL